MIDTLIHIIFYAIGFAIGAYIEYRVWLYGFNKKHNAKKNVK